jgi:hypothetical protein
MNAAPHGPKLAVKPRRHFCAAMTILTPDKSALVLHNLGATQMLYAVTDPRDNYVEAYFDTLERAKDYAQFLETSAAHPYRAYNVRFKIARVEAA